jgi:membrane-bound lytic murein transglycosylase B
LTKVEDARMSRAAIIGVAIVGGVLFATAWLLGGFGGTPPVRLPEAMPAAPTPVAATPATPEVAAPTITVLGPVPVPATLPPGAELAFASFVAGLTTEAQAAGVSAATYEAATAGLTPDPQVLELSQTQPEHAKSVSEYVTALVSETRLENGLKNLAANEAVARQIEAAYGVDRHVLIAIWGIESNYGNAQGSRGVIRSLATLAALEPRRPQFWKAELLAALRILQARDTTLENMAGSWAGAMGHTQFMPTTFHAHAVDFDRDGRRDIWGTVPDALASTANYLKASGWIAGMPWGIEVRVPEAFDYGHSAPGQGRPLAQWQALGVVPLGAKPLPANLGQMTLVLPSGAGGPAFLTTVNFRAILRYNNAVSYALSVAHLADRLAGGPAFTTPWPANDRGLSRNDREELQRRLTALGLDTGGVDGILGSGSRTAIRTYQKAKGAPEDGHPSASLLERLRAEGGAEVKVAQ